MSWVLNTAYALLESAGYRPRELYTLARGNQVWRMTGGTSPISMFVRPDISYTPALITRDTIERTDESRANAVTVRVARTAPIADEVRAVHSEPMRCRIERWQDKDSDHPAPVCIADGDVANVRMRGGWVEFDVLTGAAIWDLPFPTRLISRQNQWPTYSEFTGVSEDDFSVETTVTAIDRSRISVAAIAEIDGTPVPDGYYDGGVIRVGGIGDHGEPMYVRKSVGTDFEINGRVIDGLDIGDTVTLVAGDNKSLLTARDKFGPQAVKNFLGFDLLPTSDLLQTGLINAPIIRSPYTTPVGVPPGDTVAGIPTALTVWQSAVETPDGASVFLTVNDPTAMLIRLEARSNDTGFDPDWTAFVSLVALDAGGTRYRFDVAKGPAGFVAVEIKITYLDPDDATEHVETIPLVYNSPFTFQQILSEGSPFLPDNFVMVEQPVGKIELRLYLTMTHDDFLILGTGASSFHEGYHALISIDARPGPYTLTLGTYPGNGITTPKPITDFLFLDGAPFNGVFALSGVAHYELLIRGGSFEFTTLT